MAWRLAKSLETLRAQINSHWPKRSTVSDGTVGDASHASRSSDHNPWIQDQGMGIVSAFDITNDARNGPDLLKLVPLFLKDKRTKYVIFDKKIYNPTINIGAPRPYTGVNAHRTHLHISVNSAKVYYDSTVPWALDPVSAPITEAVQAKVPAQKQTLKRGMTAGDVPILQGLLKTLGYYVGRIDGHFGPKTESAVKALQKAKNLVVDGIVGSKTWSALNEAVSILQSGSGSNGPRDSSFVSNEQTKTGKGLFSLDSTGVPPMQQSSGKPYVPHDAGQNGVSIGQARSQGRRSPQNPLSATGDRPSAGASKPSVAPTSQATSSPKNLDVPVSVPQQAIKLFESLGWSHNASIALTANLMWESGGNATGTILTNAIGDAGKSHGAGQWNGPRYLALLDFAEGKGKSSADLETQLLFVDHELHTTERKAGIALRAAATIEEAVAAAITYWRPSIPHADKRLAIAKALLQ